ncbi:MAG: hypothetical protein EOP24_18220 [Hyphomicrobiales bacterium]|nr:MAG: hypothetical protein EOP24_18220 [Hyphomicrobiales bacterium]
MGGRRCRPRRRPGEPRPLPPRHGLRRPRLPRRNQRRCHRAAHRGVGPRRCRTDPRAERGLRTTERDGPSHPPP